MTKTALCLVGLLALLVVVSSSCHDPTSPTPVTPTQPTTSAPAPGPPPPPPAPRGGPFPGAGTYEFVSSPGGRAVYAYTSDSRYVLNDDGTFALQSPSFEFKGRYKYENEHVIFDFDWNSQTEGAVAVFDGNRMAVTYNWYMGMADFEDAVYQLK
jgi:hypothetical protein